MVKGFLLATGEVDMRAAGARDLVQPVAALADDDGLHAGARQLGADIDAALFRPAGRQARDELQDDGRFIRVQKAASIFRV